MHRGRVRAFIVLLSLAIGTLGNVSNVGIFSVQRPIGPPAVSFDLQILIPLYIYPADTLAWDEIARANSQVPITAVINPGNGPAGGPPNQDYTQGLQTLREAGVMLLGYVYTHYGARALHQVKAEIELYKRYFDLHGIFLDQVAATADHLDYYEQLYRTVKAGSQAYKVVLNPGAPLDKNYFLRSICDTAIIFENTPHNWSIYQQAAYVNAYPAEHFAILLHSVPDIPTMQAQIDLAAARNISYVYLTNRSLPNPWDTLPVFWKAQIEYIASLNSRKKLR